MSTRWYEEDVHLAFQRYPKNPYHRVDCLAGSRRLRVEVDGVVLVDTTDTLGVYETALAPRLYVSKDAIRMELLTVNPTTTSWCSYKGHATWWNVTVSGVTLADVAWSYENPLPESVALGGMVSFDEQLATVLADLPGAGGEGRCQPTAVRSMSRRPVSHAGRTPSIRGGACSRRAHLAAVPSRAERCWSVRVGRAR